MASVSLLLDGFMADYDLAIIGGGLNGVSLARDAAGRGLRVILLEQGDLGGAASSATPRLIHGDLSVLERRGFRRVRRALAERRTWLRIAPHLVRPMRFVIPAHSDERPPWLLRAGLLLYDSLTSRSGLPGATTLDITHHPVGNALKRPFGTAFEYSDCVVDDSRLVVLTALDAAERGAAIRTGARCVRADRTDTWRLAVVDRGHRRTITARALANATGGWTSIVAETVLRQPQPAMAAMQMSQIVVPRLFDSDNVYVFQNSDGPADLREPLRARLHADRHDHARFHRRSRDRRDAGGRRRLSLRSGQSLFPRADRPDRRGARGFRRQPDAGIHAPP
ncbi:glycerol-3-phosphate dehydrogenase [Bradyrhizobium sp. LM3.4]